MKRHPQWSARLFAVASAWRDIPLAYGSSDCGRFAANVADAVLGTHLIERVTYSTAREAIAFYRKYGNVRQTVTALLGELAVFKVGPPVRRGDLGQIGRHALAACFGAQTLAQTDIGLRPIDRRLLRPWHWELG
jgi:hypothetical protein